MVGHCKDTWWLVTNVNFQSGEDNIYFKKTNNPTARMANKPQQCYFHTQSLFYPPPISWPPTARALTQLHGPCAAGRSNLPGARRMYRGDMGILQGFIGNIYIYTCNRDCIRIIGATTGVYTGVT